MRSFKQVVGRVAIVTSARRYLLVLGVSCLLLTTTAPANAENAPVQCEVQMGDITIDATWDEGYGTFDGVLCDKVDIYLTGISGRVPGPGSDVGAVAGMWTGSQQFYVFNQAATEGMFKYHTTISPALSGLYYGAYSAVNFSVPLSGRPTPWARQSGTDATYWSNLIEGGWINSDDDVEYWTPAVIGAGEDSDGDGVPENLICSMIVKSAAAPQTITFGDGTKGSGFACRAGDVLITYFTVTKIPEPSTLVLLAIGAIGLLGRLWRKGV
jgi:hypothetical protein